MTNEKNKPLIVEYKTWEELAEPLAERGVDVDTVGLVRRNQAVTWWGWYGFPAVQTSSGDELWEAHGGPMMDRLASFLKGHSGRVYVAGRVREIERVRTVQQILREAGYEITYDWTSDEVPADRTSDAAILDGQRITECARNGIVSADAVVVLWPLPSEAHHGVGLLVEAGMAVLRKKKIVISGPAINSSFWSEDGTQRVTSDREIRFHVQRAITTLDQDPLLS